MISSFPPQKPAGHCHHPVIGKQALWRSHSGHSGEAPASFAMPVTGTKLTSISTLNMSAFGRKGTSLMGWPMSAKSSVRRHAWTTRSTSTSPAVGNQH
jgi:hypothetical protein